MTHSSSSQMSYKMSGKEHLIGADIMEAQNVKGFAGGFSVRRTASNKVRMRVLSTQRGRAQKTGGCWDPR